MYRILLDGFEFGGGTRRFDSAEAAEAYIKEKNLARLCQYDVRVVAV